MVGYYSNTRLNLFNRVELFHLLHACLGTQSFCADGRAERDGVGEAALHKIPKSRDKAASLPAFLFILVGHFGTHEQYA